MSFSDTLKKVGVLYLAFAGCSLLLVLAVVVFVFVVLFSALSNPSSVAPQSTPAENSSEMPKKKG